MRSSLKPTRSVRLILVLMHYLLLAGPLQIRVPYLPYPLHLASSALLFASASEAGSADPAAHDGPESLAIGRNLFQQGDYESAAPHFWRAVLLHGESPRGSYTVEEAFGPFIKCYSIRDKTADGFVFVATESIRRGQVDMARTYVRTALEVDPKHAGALELQRILSSDAAGGGVLGGGSTSSNGSGDGESKAADTTDENGKTPEQLYNEGTELFAQKKHALAAKAFQRSCDISKGRIGVACTNAVYCRTNILDWGTNGTQFDADMNLVETITRMEVASYRTVDASGNVHWKRSTSAHPHMMLGYPVDSNLKRYVSESYAAMDEILARVSESGTELPSLPPDLPYDQDDNRAKYIFDVADSGKEFRIRIAFVASGFNSKAVLYLSQDMFRFFNPDEFEVHIFSLGPPDNPAFIHHTMRGVDWRERVKSNVDVFHDVQHLKNDHIALARYIHSQDIHILIEWDGYARQGERAQGLFALRPAPVQILHQEFLGSSGAPYVDYIVTDEVTSPEKLESLYSEKFIYMPWHFFSKGHAMQKEVKLPTYEYAPASVPYKLGTGSPQENRCLAPNDLGPNDVSFVYCNFNKFLKNNPETLRSWINILRSVPDSILCLLENPTEGVPYLRNSVKEASVGYDDAEDLNARIHFLPWQANPFDHQMRAQDFCNVMLDSHPYNGHTTAQDSLYGGVPIVTRSDGDDMSSRVSTSANVILEMSDLNAVDGVSQYVEIATKLGTDSKYYSSKRTKLIDSCLQQNPLHPYWDVPRYTRNFETGLKHAWEQYLSGKPKQHIYVKEGDETKKGTYESDIARLEDARRHAKAKRRKKNTQGEEL